MSQTPRLNLPLIQPAQAQKHITHNEALALLDGLAQLSLKALDQNAPPLNAQEGDVYGVGPDASDVWAGQAGALAVFSGGGWTFVPPRTGWRAWDLNRDQLMIYRDGAWHAEMGLAGETAFSIKVSADGANWVTALRADAGQGAVQIDLPVTGQAVQQSAEDTTTGRLMRADWGYGPGNVVGGVAMSGTVPSGAVIERGDTALGSYVKWADGTQICWAEVVLTRLDAGTLEANWSFPAAFAQDPVATVSLRDETAVSVSPRDLSGPFAAEATGGARLRLYAAGNVAGFVTGDTATARVMAIGRWA